MTGSSKLEDWENYPQNLRGVTFHDHEYDLQSYSSQLRDDSDRLFVGPDDPIDLKIINFGREASEIMIRERSRLEGYLKDLDLNAGFQLILIPQQSSWGRLVVDEGSVRKVLTNLNAFPRFLDVLRSFGRRIGFEDDSAGGIYLRSGKRNSTHETAYLVKLVEEHGRAENGDPWSIRQMGVYHQTHGQSGNMFIIVKPSKSFLRRLRCMREDPSGISAGALHAMILSCSMENWRWYITDLEKRYIAMKSRAQLTKVVESPEAPFSVNSLRIEDAQEIQVLQDKCQQLAHVLDLNCELIRELRRHLERISAPDSCAESLVSLLSESTVHAKRADRLLKRLDGTIALTQKILDFRCLASLQNSSAAVERLARLTREDNLMMRDLTEKAAKDTDAMRWITFLTLIYLPASFVATMMGMDYISVGTTNGNLSIRFAGEFWIFFFLTGVFLVITLVLYYVYIMRTRLCGTNDSTSRGIRKGKFVSTH